MDEQVSGKPTAKTMGEPTEKHKISADQALKNIETTIAEINTLLIQKSILENTSAEEIKIHIQENYEIEKNEIGIENKDNFILLPKSKTIGILKNKLSKKIKTLLEIPKNIKLETPSEILLEFGHDLNLDTDIEENKFKYDKDCQIELDADFAKLIERARDNGDQKINLSAAQYNEFILSKVNEKIMNNIQKSMESAISKILETDKSENKDALHAILKAQIEMLKEVAEDTTAEKNLGRMGFLITAIAMLGQGLLGGLLGDKLIHEQAGVNDKTGRGIVAVIAAFTAFIGKLSIVHFYNDASFKNLANVFTRDFWYNDFSDLLNRIWSLVPSLVFGDLARSGMTLSEDLIKKDYNLDASWLNDSYIQSPFMASATWCNTMGFPYIHKGGLSLLSDFYNHCIENPEYRENKEKVRREMQAFRNQIAALYESQDPEKRKKAKVLLEKLLPYLETGNIQGARMALLELSQTVPSEFRENPEGWGEFLAKHTLGLTFAGGTIWGFSNFFSLGMATGATFLVGLSSLPLWVITASSAVLYSAAAVSTVQGLNHFFSLSMAIGGTFLLGLHFLPLATITGLSILPGIMMALSMAAMAEGPYRTATSFFDYMMGRNRSLQILESWQLALTHILTSTACITGVTPNVYQSLVMIKQALDTVIASAWASFIVEYGGFAALFTQWLEGRKKAGDDEALLFKHVDDFLAKAVNLQFVSKEEAEKLYNQFKQTEAQALRTSTDEVPNTLAINETSVDIDQKEKDALGEKINLIKNKPPQYRENYTWAKEGIASFAASIGQCFWGEDSAPAAQTSTPHPTQNSILNYS